MEENTKILVLGARGLVGSSLVRELKNQRYKNILAPSREELDLLNQEKVLNYFHKNKPEYVVNAAAKVGGIQANNTYRADFITQNLTIQNNIFQGAFEAKVAKFLFLGSSCIYPKDCPQPIKEESLLTGLLEPTNEPYAIAKIAGLKTAESYKKQYNCNYFSVMPTNLYGENDNFHKEHSHVIPGLIARMKESIDRNDSTFEIWGTGRPRREFLYVDDMAQACIFLLQTSQPLPHYLNIGTGEDISIAELAKMISKLMGFKGKLIFNTDYPDGTMKKCLDISKIKALGWSPRISLQDGLKKSIQFYLNSENIRNK